MRPVQEVTGARFLHDLGPCVAAHVTEAIITEDDGTVLNPRVGYDKLSTCIRVKQRENERDRGCERKQKVTDLTHLKQKYYC